MDVRQPKLKADHSSLSRVEDKKEWIYASTLVYIFMKYTRTAVTVTLTYLAYEVYIINILHNYAFFICILANI